MLTQKRDGRDSPAATEPVDYGQSPKNTAAKNDPARQSSETEPADPDPSDLGDLPDRESTPLASSSYDVEELPPPLVACGCDGCFSFTDPLAEGGAPVYVDPEECANPCPASVGKAGEVYRVYGLAAARRDDWGNDWLSRGRRRYRQIMMAGRQMRAEYGDDLTTVLLSLRCSPIAVGDDGERGWHPPLRLDSWIHEAWGSVRDAIDYRFSRDGFDFEYQTITAGTVSCATPHRHALYYIRDPNDEIGRQHFESGLAKHIEQVPTAYPEDHGEGAVHVEHDPPLVEDPPAKAAEIIREADGDSFPALTRAAVYLGSQLPHLDALGDAAKQDSTDTDASTETADGGVKAAGADDNGQSSKNAKSAYQTGAIAWASSYDWITRSGGL